MSLVLAGNTSGSTTLQATDAVTATITLPSATGTLTALDSSGRLTLTNTVPTTDINGLTLSGSTTGGNAIYVANTTGGILIGIDNSVGGGITGSGPYDSFIVSRNQPLLFSTTNGASIAAILNTSGGLQTLNTISVGNATPSTSGAGITFPATQSASTDANTLDDYEEGTWTPVLNSWTNVGSPTISGTYVKVGKMVTAICYVTPATSVSATTITSTISGLPFTVASNYGSMSAALNTGGQLQCGLVFSTSMYPPTTGVTTAGVTLTTTYFV